MSCDRSGQRPSNEGGRAQHDPPKRQIGKVAIPKAPLMELSSMPLPVTVLLYCAGFVPSVGGFCPGGQMARWLCLALFDRFRTRSRRTFRPTSPTNPGAAPTASATRSVWMPDPMTEQLYRKSRGGKGAGRFRRWLWCGAGGALLLACLALPSLGRSQGGKRPAHPFAQLQWGFIGPIGNRASAIVGDPGNPAVVCIGAASGGIWKTSDGGSGADLGPAAGDLGVNQHYQHGLARSSAALKPLVETGTPAFSRLLKAHGLTMQIEP